MAMATTATESAATPIQRILGGSAAAAIGERASDPQSGCASEETAPNRPLEDALQLVHLYAERIAYVRSRYATASQTVCGARLTSGRHDRGRDTDAG